MSKITVYTLWSIVFYITLEVSLNSRIIGNFLGSELCNRFSTFEENGKYIKLKNKHENKLQSTNSMYY